MTRIVPDIQASDPTAAEAFYGGVLGLSCLMDQGWVTTYGNPGDKAVQITFATGGGSGAPTPGLTIEVDNLHEAEQRCRRAGIPIVYGPILEPWGIRRFFVHDPFGTLINIAVHEH